LLINLGSMNVFNPNELKKLYQPKSDSSGEDNGSITIIGGSELFHGAPILSLKVASRICDMVFFATPEKSVGQVAENIKSKLMSFVWVPWEDVDEYIEKSDAVLIGPGMMRFRSEKVPHAERHNICDEACQETRSITQRFLSKYKSKRWVIDGGSLQVMEADWIPKDAIITPNKKEFQILFNSQFSISNSQSFAKKYHCVIVAKGQETIVASPTDCVLVKGGNAGMTKGGTGDVLAGLTVALLAKNDPFLAASASSYIEKKAADMLFSKLGTGYNADDLADFLPQVFKLDTAK